MEGWKLKDKQRNLKYDAWKLMQRKKKLKTWKLRRQHEKPKEDVSKLMQQKTKLKREIQKPRGNPNPKEKIWKLKQKRRKLEITAAGHVETVAANKEAEGGCGEAVPCGKREDETEEHDVETGKR